MKTVKQWLDGIEDTAIREKALKNLNLNDKEVSSHIGRESVHDALIAAFAWEKTEEGNDYWSTVFDMLYKQSRDSKGDSTNEIEIKNGDIFDIGQTVNGVSRFVWLNGKWHYYEPTMDREYEYSQESLTKLIHEDRMNYGADADSQWIGNIFSVLPNSI